MENPHFHDGNLINFNFELSKNKIILKLKLDVYKNLNDKKRNICEFIFYDVNEFAYNCNSLEVKNNFTFGFISDGELIHEHGFDIMRLTLVDDGFLNVKGHLM